MFDLMQIETEISCVIFHRNRWEHVMKLIHSRFVMIMIPRPSMTTSRSLGPYLIGMLCEWFRPIAGSR